MKHLALLLFALLFLSQKTFAQSADCGCTNCPQFMPDGFMDAFYFYVGAAANNDLAHPAQEVCEVRISFDHEYVSDLSMYLTSPAGQSLTLVGPTGFFGPTDGARWNISFVPCAAAALPDDSFSAIWNNDQAWGMNSYYSGAYYPAEGCLEQFDTGPVVGIWRLDIADGQAIDVGNLYDFEIFFCDTDGVACSVSLGQPTASLMANTSGWDVLLQNNSVQASTYDVDFGDGQSFSGTPLPTSHSYADTGHYLLRLIARNPLGADTSEQSVLITGALPAASAIAQPTSGCAPLPVQITVSGAAPADEWHWLLPGATPAESFDMEPAVVYDTSGIYSATLIVTNAVGADTLYYPAFVEVKPELLHPGFTVQVQGDSIIATNTTQGFTEYYWLLNDVLIAAGTAQQQVFHVDSSGTYLITLYVANDCDTAFIQQSVPVILSGVKDSGHEVFELLLLPNPNHGRCRLELVSPEDLPAEVVILNTAGQKVFAQKTSLVAGKNAHDLDLGQLSPGFYLLRLQTALGAKTISFTLQK